MMWHGVLCTVNVCTVQYQQAEGMERASVGTAAKEGATSRLPGDKRGYIATGKVRARPCEERRGDERRGRGREKIRTLDRFSLSMAQRRPDKPRTERGSGI